jgi:hypothetical protein
VPLLPKRGRRFLRLAAAKLNAPVDRLRVTNGVVTVDGDPGPAVTYGDLIGDRQFNVKMTGKAPQKSVAHYTLVGTGQAGVTRDTRPRAAIRP